MADRDSRLYMTDHQIEQEALSRLQVAYYIERALPEHERDLEWVESIAVALFNWVNEPRQVTEFSEMGGGI